MHWHSENQAGSNSIITMRKPTMYFSLCRKTGNTLREYRSAFKIIGRYFSEGDFSSDEIIW